MVRRCSMMVVRNFRSAMQITVSGYDRRNRKARIASYTLSRSRNHASCSPAVQRENATSTSTSAVYLAVSSCASLVCSCLRCSNLARLVVVGRFNAPCSLCGRYAKCWLLRGYTSHSLLAWPSTCCTTTSGISSSTASVPNVCKKACGDLYSNWTRSLGVSSGAY
jgi:hypothetical protein